MVAALIIGSLACAKRKLVNVHLSRFQIRFCESPAGGKEAKFSPGRDEREMLAAGEPPGSSPARTGAAFWVPAQSPLPGFFSPGPGLFQELGGWRGRVREKHLERVAGKGTAHCRVPRSSAELGSKPSSGSFWLPRFPVSQLPCI